MANPQTSAYGPTGSVYSEGTIAAHSFVTTGTDARRVKQAGAGDVPTGIALAGTNTNIADGEQTIPVARDGGVEIPKLPVKLKIGAGQVGTLKRGQHLKPDASGFAVAGTFGTDNCGALLVTKAALAGDVADVIPLSTGP